MKRLLALLACLWPFVALYGAFYLHHLWDWDQALSQYGDQHWWVTPTVLVSLILFGAFILGSISVFAWGVRNLKWEAGS